VRQNLLPFATMTAGAEIRILIVDDNMLIRSATKMVLNTCKDFTVVGEAHDGLTGIKMALELEPDVVLMDINMSPVNGIKATSILLSQSPSVLVIGFSALPHKHEEQQMINAGAAGVIHKSATRETICQSIIHYYRQSIIQKR
jgi:DNA-binding NarL/FixJ family response regulator